MTSFSATVADWVTENKEKQLVVLQLAAQLLIEDANTPVAKGGNMPVDTGFLRASFTGSLNAPVQNVTFNTNEVPTPYNDDYVFFLNQMEPGDTFFGVWTANYAVHQEYGANGRVGRRFAGLAAQKWQDFVDQAVLIVRRI